MKESFLPCKLGTLEVVSGTAKGRLRKHGLKLHGEWKVTREPAEDKNV